MTPYKLLGIKFSPLYGGFLLHLIGMYGTITLKYKIKGDCNGKIIKRSHAKG